MKRIAGYTLFWISVGMLIALLIANTFWNVLLIFVLLLISERKVMKKIFYSLIFF